MRGSGHTRAVASSGMPMMSRRPRRAAAVLAAGKPVPAPDDESVATREQRWVTKRPQDEPVRKTHDHTPQGAVGRAGGRNGGCVAVGRKWRAAAACATAAAGIPVKALEILPPSVRCPTGASVQNRLGSRRRVSAPGRSAAKPMQRRQHRVAARAGTGGGAGVQPRGYAMVYGN
jgi:hypothetical protein